MLVWLLKKNEIVEDTVTQTIKRLKNAYMKSDGWREIISDIDQQDMCTNHDIHMFPSKALYLAIALQLAMDHMQTKTWRVCCDEVIIKVKKFHQENWEITNQ